MTSERAAGDMLFSYKPNVLPPPDQIGYASESGYVGGNFRLRCPDGGPLERSGWTCRGRW